MTHRIVAFAAAAAALALPWTAASGRATGTLAQAALAWDRGEYVEALSTYLQALDTADAAAFETIALQTGELFENNEITTDGDAPRFSPDGRYFSYESGTLLELDRRIHLVEATNRQQVRTIPSASRGTFATDGRTFAYLRLQPSDTVREARAAVEAASPAERSQRLATFNALVWRDARVIVRDLPSGREREIAGAGLRTTGVVATPHGVLFTASRGDGAPAQIHIAASSGSPVALTGGDGEHMLGEANAAGTAVLFTVRAAGTAASQASRSFGLVSLPSRDTVTIEGTAPAFSADGTTLAYVARQGDEHLLMLADVRHPTRPAILRRGPERLDAPALSRDGARVAFQVMPRDDWEIFLLNRDGSGETRVTREIQHDVLPRFLDDGKLLATVGEARHRRSQIYDLSSPAPSDTRVRMFHNNTVRTIAPEYAWAPSPDGRRVLVVAERDGDTVSPERGLYLVDLERRVTRDAVRERLRRNLAAERALRAKGQRLFAPIAGDVNTVTGEVSVPRIFAYQKALFDFDSKHISRPGNRRAAQYLFDTYKSFGYAPEYQWFSARGAAGGQTANVIATLVGTTNPELVYVVSSHYDSVAAGPGADDNSSGTAALLETARVLAARPQPATIVFASFTGEESGLLGSREWVRRAVVDRVRLAGALNNDMIGWTNDHRLDNTIRYSNAGIRDIQHAAAMQFSAMVTYDALYYKSTDAAAYYEAYGDIVGGIGSYPVLGNPHYHQPHDLLDTINHRLVAEVAKTTAATLMLLASSPSRLGGLEAERLPGGTVRLRWSPAPEKGITGYIVAYGPAENPEAQQVRVGSPSATLPRVPPKTVVSVKAVNARGLEGWDWARVVVP